MRYLRIAVLLCLLPAFAQAQISKPKTSATPATRTAASEKVRFDAAAAIVPPDLRADALSKYVAAFPKSARLTEALEMLAAARVDAGNAKLNTGDVEGALAIFKLAAAEAPTPIPDKLWREHFATLAAKLYSGGARDTAYAVGNSLEAKADGNVKQLLGLASFYLGVEDGSKGRQLAEKVIELEPNSTLGYQALGFAHRVNFQLEDAATAFGRALELEPGSATSRRSLAELKRALGKADEAAALYRDALARDENDLAAQTGLVLALFDAGKRSEAEAEFTKAVAMNDSNVLLLGSVAYWYAAQRDGDKAIELATKAVEKDPRFVWSHIALARALLINGRAADAERVLLGARAYGNFPALSYELAATRAAGGYYREAGEELARVFAIKDGMISTKLGGRIARESKDILELVGLERRASIFAPTASDDPESAERLTALLELEQAVDAAEPNAEVAMRAADAFTAGSDKMRVYRQLYAASVLLDKKIALPRVVELARAASAGVDAAAELPGSPAAIMADELYAARSEAASRGQYLDVPPVAKSVIASILRGRIEDIAGWALFQQEQPGEAVVRLRRAAGILPVDSAWWRASMWHLGMALAASGKEQEALDVYVKAYRSGGPDRLRYMTVRGLYERIKGSTDGLDALVGENPSPETVAAAQAAPTPTPSPEPAVGPTPAPTPIVDAVIPTPEPQIDQKAKSSDTPVAGGCTITASEDSLTLAAGGADLAIMIGVDQGELDGLKVTPSSLADISITREIVAGVRSRAVFVVRSSTGKAGLYSIMFELPCGKREIPVRVQ